MHAAWTGVHKDLFVLSRDVVFTRNPDSAYNNRLLWDSSIGQIKNVILLELVSSHSVEHLSRRFAAYCFYTHCQDGQSARCSAGDRHFSQFVHLCGHGYGIFC